MVVTAVLWQYWQEQQYEEAITEVCASLDIKEEEVSSFNGDQELLAAAGDTQPLGFHWSPDKENLALFGCSCCNRLTEKHLRSDWRVAAHWCALARHLEGDASTASAGRWALARFHRLFNAAEAIRVAGNAESDARKQHFLEASQRCLRACEAMWLRWPSCTSSPESIYTCLAEVCWQLKDIDSVRSSCRKALSLFMSTDRLSPAKAYACMFVLWVFQSAALDVFSWREVRAALHCAKDILERLQACGLSAQDLRPHSRIMKRLQRQGQVVPMAPLGLAEAQLELGLDYVEKNTFPHEVQPASSVHKNEVAVMTEEEPQPPPPPVQPCVGSEDDCTEIMAFLESLDAEAPDEAASKPGCLDNLLLAAEDALQISEGGLGDTLEATKAADMELHGLTKTPRRWKRRCFTSDREEMSEGTEEHPPPWLSIPVVHEAWQCHSVDSRPEALETRSTPSTKAWTPLPSPKAEAKEAKEVPEPPMESATVPSRFESKRHRMVRKPPVPKVPVSEVQASKSFTPLRDGIRLPEPPRSGRSVSLHLAEDCQEMPQRKRERRKAPLPKWSQRPNSGYARPAASLRPAVPVACRPFVSGSTDEPISRCSTNASCSTESSEVQSRSLQKRNKASSTSLSALPPEVDVDASEVPWAFRGIRRQIEPPHLHFGHIPRRPAFEIDS